MARELRLFVAREVAPGLPPAEKYRLAAQMIDAARSVSANIAEGYGRHHYLDNAKFCRNANGSCCEVLDHLITAYDEGMIPEAVLTKGREKVGHCLRLLNGYIGYLRRVGGG